MPSKARQARKRISCALRRIFNWVRPLRAEVSDPGARMTHESINTAEPIAVPRREDPQRILVADGLRRALWVLFWVEVAAAAAVLALTPFAGEGLAVTLLLAAFLLVLAPVAIIGGLWVKLVPHLAFEAPWRAAGYFVLVIVCSVAAWLAIARILTLAALTVGIIFV